jgi:hypothetical protein
MFCITEGIELDEIKEDAAAGGARPCVRALNKSKRSPLKRLKTDHHLPDQIIAKSEFGSVVGIACHELDVAIKQPTLFHASFSFEPNTVNASKQSRRECAGIVRLTSDAFLCVVYLCSSGPEWCRQIDAAHSVGAQIR